MGKKLVGLALWLIAIVLTFTIARLITQVLVFFTTSPNTSGDAVAVSGLLGLFQFALWVGLMFLSAKIVRRYLYAKKD